MSDIEELQRRIVAAMDRIGAGVERVSQGGGDPGLADELEEEKLANAQLQERLRSLHERHDDEMAQMKAQLQELEDLKSLQDDIQQQATELSRLDTDLQRLRQAKGGKAAGAKLGNILLANGRGGEAAQPRRNFDPTAQRAGGEILAISDFILADQPHIIGERIARAKSVAGGQIGGLGLVQRERSAGRQFQTIAKRALGHAAFEHG